MRGGWVYIMTNRPNGTLYVGVTSDLPRRAWEHRTGAVDGFTKRHDLKLLVYAERHDEIAYAIQREKVLKHWPRLQGAADCQQQPALRRSVRSSGMKTWIPGLGQAAAPGMTKKGERRGSAFGCPGDNDPGQRVAA